MEARRFTVQGRVQGVFYRVTTRERARDLGLTGWVRNESDGETVTIFVQGEPEQLEQFHAFLHKGPPAAQVSVVKEEYADPDPLLTDFTVAY